MGRAALRVPPAFRWHSLQGTLKIGNLAGGPNRVDYDQYREL